MKQLHLFLVLLGFSSTLLGSERPFITTWKLPDIKNQKKADQLIIKINPKFKGQYNYKIDCNSDGKWEAEGVKGDYNCGKMIPGKIYSVSISGDFPAISYGGIYLICNNLIEINQWGDIKWKSMRSAFSGCRNVVGKYSDKPDLTMVKDMTKMFFQAWAFNGKVSDWDVRSVEMMGCLFTGTQQFNGDLSKWDVSRVKCMSGFLFGANAFNQDLSLWNVKNVLYYDHFHHSKHPKWKARYPKWRKRRFIKLNKKDLYQEVLDSISLGDACLRD